MVWDSFLEGQRARPARLLGVTSRQEDALYYREPSRAERGLHRAVRGPLAARPQIPSQNTPPFLRPEKRPRPRLIHHPKIARFRLGTRKTLGLAPPQPRPCLSELSPSYGPPKKPSQNTPPYWPRKKYLSQRFTSDLTPTKTWTRARMAPSRGGTQRAETAAEEAVRLCELAVAMRYLSDDPLTDGDDENDEDEGEENNHQAEWMMRGREGGDSEEVLEEDGEEGEEGEEGEVGEEGEEGAGEQEGLEQQAKGRVRPRWPTARNSERALRRAASAARTCAMSASTTRSFGTTAAAARLPPRSLWSSQSDFSFRSVRYFFSFGVSAPA
ncbi:hypothetical protein T492DRAFT_529041 [Pavlovales sp. CCMP2436]|nr:hypothetical protein T492DRAFT_529041 [Pavlovales sp. CCMP2436]